MRVAVNGWFLGQATAGSGQYLHHLLEHLPRRFPQLRLCVYAPRMGQNTDAKRRAQLSARFSGVEIIWRNLMPVPRALAKLWWEQFTLPAAARTAAVLWVPYWAAPLWQPCPTVVTVHDLIPARLPAYRGGRLQQLYTRLVSHTARRAAAVITVSHAAAGDIATHLQIPGPRIHVVHHGPNHSHPHASTPPRAPHIDAEVVRLRYGLPTRYFLYLGGFDVRKNVPAVIAAYARYLEKGGNPTIHLVIGGALPAVDTPFMPDPRRVAAAHNLGKQVHFCGFVADEHKAALYAMAHAYLFPSLYEGFGMMILEAMAAGTPVVTSGSCS